MSLPSPPFRILIFDNVIINAGDAAILLGMKAALEEAFGPHAEVRNDYFGANAPVEVYQKFYPEVRFLPTPQTAAYDKPIPSRQIVQRLIKKTAAWRFLWQARLQRRRIPLPLLTPKERALFAEYLRTDLFVVAGGAALSTSWTTARQRSERTAKYWTALELGKPLAFYAMSVGPFLPEDPLPALLKPLMERSLAVLCRDADSFRVVREEVGVTGDNVHRTIDAALSLTPRVPKASLIPPQRKPLRVGVCVHQWHWLGVTDSDAAQRAFEGRMVQVCRTLLERGDVELLFLTTHQGVDGIPRDDDVSLRIRDGLPETLRADAHVVTEFIHPQDFAYAMGQCAMVVSSRLHGAVMSMVGGAPVVALAYEPKTRGLMEQIGLEDWVLSMGDSSAEDILTLAHSILADADSARQRLQVALDKGRALSRRNQEIIREAYCRIAETRD